MKKGAAIKAALALGACAALLGGCFDARVLMQDPRTGAMQDCRPEAGGLSPWSQGGYGYAARQVAQGWVPSGSPPQQ